MFRSRCASLQRARTPSSLANILPLALTMVNERNLKKSAEARFYLLGFIRSDESVRLQFLSDSIEALERSDAQRSAPLWPKS